MGRFVTSRTSAVIVEKQKESSSKPQRCTMVAQKANDYLKRQLTLVQFLSIDTMYQILQNMDSYGYFTEEFIQENILVNGILCLDVSNQALMLKSVIMYVILNQVPLARETFCLLLQKLIDTEGHAQVVFEEILKPLNGGNIEDFYPTLRYVLRHTDDHIFYLGGKECRLLDVPLLFGESPLMAACKNRRPGAVGVLLRYGAKTNGDWLNYTNALQVLLFSPNKVHLDEKDQRNLLRCMKVLIGATGPVDLSELLELQKSGYCPLLDQWRHLLEKCESVGACSLQKLCKLKIRQSLIIHGSMPNNISKLPLPRRVKDFIDLKHIL